MPCQACLSRMDYYSAHYPCVALKDTHRERLLQESRHSHNCNLERSTKRREWCLLFFNGPTWKSKDKKGYTHDIIG